MKKEHELCKGRQAKLWKQVRLPEVLENPWNFYYCHFLSVMLMLSCDKVVGSRGGKKIARQKLQLNPLVTGKLLTCLSQQVRLEFL